MDTTMVMGNMVSMVNMAMGKNTATDMGMVMVNNTL